MFFSCVKIPENQNIRRNFLLLVPKNEDEIIFNSSKLDLLVQMFSQNGTNLLK